MTEALPRVTFFLFAYNQEAFIREACEAALAQTYSSLDIIFSDDCSSDRTFEIMQEVVEKYTGAHSIRLNRNERNLGLIGHVNLSDELVTTDLTIVAAGDDISLPHRTETIVQAYLENKGRIFSFHSDATVIDANGNILSVWHPRLNENKLLPDDLAESMSLVIGATHAWTRETFQVFGPIQFAGAYEDLVIAFRSVLLGGVCYINQPLVKYRIGHGLTSSYWYSAKSRREQQARVLKRLKMSIDVLSQRRNDCLALGQHRLAEVLNAACAARKIDLLVYEREVSFFVLLFKAIEERCLKGFFKSYFRRLRGRA